MNQKLIRVCEEDEESLMDNCVTLFLKSHPEMKGIYLSRKFMFKKVVEYYLK